MGADRDDGSRYGLLTGASVEAPSDAAALDRARGCLIGQLAGDSLGGQVEFQDADAILATHPEGVRHLRDGGHWRTLAGQPTDDSEMALMLGRSIIARRGFDVRDVLAAYVHWYESRPFDMGNTVASALGAAAEAQRRGGDPLAEVAAAANPNSQANGALMRVSPVGIFGHTAPPDLVAEWARRDAALTHPHPACRDASALFTVTIAYAIRTGDGAAGVYRWAVRWAAEADLHPFVQSWLAAAANEPPPDYMTQMGWVRIALQNAFHRLLHEPSPEEGIVRTVMQGGDTDTNAAVAGALLGAVHGVAAIPARWRDAVLSCRPERGRPDVRRPRPRDFWPVDAMVLAERLLVLGRGAGSTPAAAGGVTC